jgi:hypothetical protein
MLRTVGGWSAGNPGAYAERKRPTANSRDGRLVLVELAGTIRELGLGLNGDQR